MSANNSNGLTVTSVAGTAYAVLATDDFVAFTNTSAKTATLPAVASVPRGKIYHLANTATGTVTVSPAAGTIDGAATLVLAATSGRATLISDGTNWLSIGLA